MKILYAIQGTGNGHLSRARDILPVLQSLGQVDILVSGTQADIALPYSVKYQMKGLGFIFGKKGGVDLRKTLLKNNLYRFLKEVSRIPITRYDLVINDFEPVSAWACYFRRKPCIALSHQCAVLSPNAPLPARKDRIGRFILQNYAPASQRYGFHFARFNQQTFTPVIRNQVRELVLANNGHYTVYLPAYSDEKIIKTLSLFPEVKWEVFSKHNKKGYICGNVVLSPINNEAFLKSMATSAGVLCGAGFETPSEALYLKKKLLVVPMENQYEQHCNAAALSLLGVRVLKNLNKKHCSTLKEWLVDDQVVEVDFPDTTKDIIHKLVSDFQVSHRNSHPVFQKQVDPSIDWLE